MLITELQSFGRAANLLDCGAISLDACLIFFLSSFFVLNMEFVDWSDWMPCNPPVSAHSVRTASTHQAF